MLLLNGIAHVNAQLGGERTAIVKGLECAAVYQSEQPEYRGGYAICNRG